MKPASKRIEMMTDMQRYQRNAREYLGLAGAAEGVAPETSDSELQAMAAQDEAQARAACESTTSA